MLFDRFKKPQAEQFLDGVLDSPDTLVLVVRGQGCTLLYKNSLAKERIKTNLLQGVKPESSKVFPGLCERCPFNEDAEEPASHHFDVKDENERYYSVTCNEIRWLDNKSARIFFLRDVDEERKTQEKLYQLAYIDHLTRIPNRQKFKSDFDAMATEIENGGKHGIIAIFDLDNFKLVNDTYGHNTGDIMLRRLTEHLNGDPAFAGHLYRLGGDEFVLFYAMDTKDLPSDVTLYEYFRDLLKSAFLAYTMPNIELACTISMGISFFPLHGDSYSDLLRKADIALYEAKAAGRNTLVFFEDKYDSAKKFKDLYINIQPILTNAGKTFGYELIDRGNEGKDNDKSLNLSEFDRTIDALGLSDMEGNTRFFIAYSNQLMNPSVLNNLPKDIFVIEINVSESFTPEDAQRCRQLRANQYTLAVTGLRQENTTPDLMELVEYCKFDQKGTSDTWKHNIIAKYPNKKFIATQVNTYEAFQQAKELGFTLHQGYFFNEKSVVKKTKEIDPMKVNYYRLLQFTITDGYVDFKEISNIISSDVAMSYKLLRLLNSAAVGLRNRVSSIDMAVAFLGEESLKKWVALLALRGLAGDKPLELVRMSLIRAQWGELLAPQFKSPRNTKNIFLVGLLSLLHIALEKSKEELLDELPVADDIRDSLLTKDGPYSDLLAFYMNYEYANWDEVSRFAKANGLNDKVISDSYIAAVKWYNDLAEDAE